MPSPSRSAGIGQPSFGSMPWWSSGSVGQASMSSGMPSLSVSRLEPSARHLARRRSLRSGDDASLSRIGTLVPTSATMRKSGAP